MAQCTATTKKGTRCSHTAKRGSKRCGHHTPHAAEHTWSGGVFYTPKYIIHDTGVWTPPRKWSARDFVYHLQTGKPKLDREYNYMCLMRDGTLHLMQARAYNSNFKRWNKFRTRKSADSAEQKRAYRNAITTNAEVVAVLNSCMSSDCTKYIDAVLPYNATISYLLKHFRDYFERTSRGSKEWYTRTDDDGLERMETDLIASLGPSPPASLKGKTVVVISGTVVHPDLHLHMRGASIVSQVTESTMCVLIPSPLGAGCKVRSKQLTNALRMGTPLATPAVIGDWLNGFYEDVEL